VTLHRDTSNSPIEVEVSRPSVTPCKCLMLNAFRLTRRSAPFTRKSKCHAQVSRSSRPSTPQLPVGGRSVRAKCAGQVCMPRSLQLRQTVTLHRDTSIPLGGSEVSRQVWTSLVRPLALTLATTTLALEGRRITASTARSAAIEAQSGTVVTYRRHNKPALGPLGGSATASTIWGR
jgi:hypothetical protein